MEISRWWSESPSGNHRFAWENGMRPGRGAGTIRPAATGSVFTGSAHWPRRQEAFSRPVRTGRERRRPFPRQCDRSRTQCARSHVPCALATPSVAVCASSTSFSSVKRLATTS